MKKTLITLFAALLAVTTLWAQTPEEILARMDKEVDRFEKEGVRVTMRDFAIGVTEEEVRFDPSKYPNAKIVDKR